MSVTITISDNRAYCQAHGMIERETFDCQCVDFPEITDCQGCQGTGKVTFEHSPFDMNLANTNFAAVWSALGLDAEYSGEIDGRTLLARLATITADAFIRDPVRYGNMISSGVILEQAERYASSLTSIATEAARREEKVVWG
jgi:hypothetical protein